MTPMKSVPRAGELDRDAEGYPEGLQQTAERRPVNISRIDGGGGHPVTAKVDQSNSGNVNHHLPWLMVAAILGAIGTTLGLVALVLYLFQGPEYMRTIARSESARAEAISEMARKEAGIAKDMMDVERAKRIAREESNVRRGR